MTFLAKSKRSAVIRRSFLSAMALVIASAPGAASAAPPLEPDVEAPPATIPAPKPSWVYVNRGFGTPGFSIWDTATGKMLGLIEGSWLADMEIDPAGKAYYVAETFWSKGFRGTRQDMVTVYDGASLKLQTEIAMPGRILVGSRLKNFVVSDDGSTGYVYNLSPASSVNVVDLAKRKFVRNIELPGCASLISNPGVGFSALCSDGSMATVSTAGAKPVITRSAPFFAATDDPIFDNFVVDKAKKEAVFLTYTGLIYTASLGANPKIAEPFSIQEAAGVRKGDTKPLDINWYPGARQQLAVHAATGHAFVLMHMGEYWTHKAECNEIWEVDLAAKKVVRRMVLERSFANIAITQEAAPKIIVSGEDGALVILDAKTGEEKFKIKSAGNGVLRTVGPS
ncbi:amine dehydrogenase large subunit [Novosphingobium sp. Chol11]|uniref:amine dehydrogenase large subunit n=1 Tax=Novosphingobium sp. Chol11 TaxID=1385763 RepID=UPI0025CDCBCB|nr:amine dehydrogenase large subunit [Novosphingobium sp. Chol11]